MSGFIYIWRDKKHKRYYVGSHWCGKRCKNKCTYVCSSTWMRQAISKRPGDFKKRILERVQDREKINEVEHRWLQMIKPDELKGKRYYNFSNNRFGHWSTDAYSRLTIGQKVSKARKGKPLSPEHRAKLKITNRGWKHREEARIKMREAAKHRANPKRGPRSEETRTKISRAATERHARWRDEGHLYTKRGPRRAIYNVMGSVYTARDHRGTF